MGRGDHSARQETGNERRNLARRLDFPCRAAHAASDLTGRRQHSPSAAQPDATYPEALEEIVDDPRRVLAPVWGPHYVSDLLRTCPVV